jgi:hypothetical protein
VKYAVKGKGDKALRMLETAGVSICTVDGHWRIPSKKHFESCRMKCGQSRKTGIIFLVK